MVNIPLNINPNVDAPSFDSVLPMPQHDDHLQKCNILNVYGTNAQSLGNKFDDITIVCQQNNVDVAVVTETWFTSNMTENQLSIPSFNLFSTPRKFDVHGKKSGGGVAIYVNDDIPATRIDYIEVPKELECIWVKIRPKRLPRTVSAIVVCAVYITTKSPHQNLLTDHLLTSIDSLRTKYPDIGILILGDFNRMKVDYVLRGNNLHQLVYFPIRGQATLDLMLVSSNLNKLYPKPVPILPIGFSDHVSILWTPKIRPKPTSSKKSVKVTHPMRESGIHEFGCWIQGLNWHEILECDGTQAKTDAFYALLEHGINKYFPEKTIKSHVEDKPWMTPHIKKLIHDRQKAFQTNNMSRWCMLCNQGKIAIDKAKVYYHVNRVRNLQKSQPRKWYQEFRKITNTGKTELKINIPGIDDSDGIDKANYINNMFADVSAHVPPLDFDELPAYLPAKDPSPHLYPWEVYSDSEESTLMNQVALMESQQD